MLFYIILLLLYLRGNSIEKSYQFDGVVQEIMYGDEGKPIIFIKGKRYFLRFTNEEFNKRKAEGEAKIREEADKYKKQAEDKLNGEKQKASAEADRVKKEGENKAKSYADSLKKAAEQKAKDQLKNLNPFKK